MARTKAQQEAYLRLMKQQRELKKKQGLETSRDVYDRYGIKNIRTVKQTPKRNTPGYTQNAARNARDIAGGKDPYAWQNQEGKTTDFKPIWSLPGLFDALDQIKKDKEKALDASDPTKTGIYADWKGNEMKPLEEKYDAAAAEKEAAQKAAQEEMNRLVEESMTRGIGAAGTPKLEDPNARNLVMLTEEERNGITVKNIAARAAEAAKQATAQEKVESARRKTAAAAEANDARKQYANALDTLIYADDVAQDKDFETYAKKGEAAANELMENIKGKGAQLGAALSNDDKTFALMTINDSELKIYSALAGKYGKEIADRYLDAITPELEERAAGKIYDDVENIDNEALKKIARWGVTAGASGQEVRRNLLNLPGAVTGSGDVTGPGTLQKARARIGENLEGVEKVVNDVTGSVINMLPAMGLSFVPGAGPALSAGYTGATSYSNAYSDAVLSGYEPGQAAAYALPSAASEALLGYVTGGVAKMGGSKSLANMAKNALAKAMSNPAVEKALGRAAEAGSEALEEYLQANLDPILRNAVLGEDNEINPVSEDKLYAALLGALTSAGMNTATDAAEIAGTVRTGKAYNSPDVMQALVQEGLASGPDTQAYGQAQRLAGKLEAGKNVSNFEAGSLAQANEAAIAAEARANAILDKTGVQRAYDPNETVKLADGREVVIVARDGSEYTAIVPGESGYTRITIDEILHRESARRAVDAYLHPEDKADITGKYDYRRVEKTADQTFLDNLQKRYGIKAVIEDLPAGTEAFYDRSTNTIHFAPDSTRADVIGGVAAHELSHAAEDSKHYKAYSDYALQKLFGNDTEALRQAVEAKQEQYIRRGIDLSDADAVAEIVADYTRSLYKSEADIEALVTGNRSMAQGIYDSIKTAIRKIRAFFKGDEAALANIREYQDLRRAQRMFEKALSTRPEVQADMEAAPAYALNPNFEAEYDAWNGVSRGGYFKIGKTSEILKSIGVKDQNIYWDKSKIVDIKKKHTDMTDDVIKAVPQLLEDPVIVMQSNTVANRIVMLGEVYDAAGNPVLAVLELKPTGRNAEIQDFAKIASAYGKRNIQGMLDTSDILYLDPNKNRTKRWLEARLGLQLPAGLTNYGSIGTVTYVNKDVNGRISFDEEHGKTAMELAMEKAKNRQYSIKDDPATIARLTKEDANTTPELNPGEAKGIGDTETSFVSNVENSQFLDDTAKQEIGSDADVRYYSRIANEDTMQAADDALRTGGEAEVREWLGKKPKEATPQDVAEGFILLKQYQDKGQYEDMVAVARKLREIGTQAGQIVQTYSILSRMTPEGMVKFAQAELESAWKAMAEGKSKKWIENNASKFELTADEAKTIAETMQKAAELPDGRDKNILLGEIQALLQRKIPSAMGEKFRSWQRISLLMNPKTNIRNILGNALMMPERIISDFVAAPIDRALSRKTGVRTTGIPNLSDYGRGFKKGAYETFDDFRRKINTQNMAGNRFEIGQSPAFNPDSAKTKLGKAVTQALASLDRITSFALEMGDRPFYEAYFINSLNNQMKLNGVDKPTAEMIDIATQDALENTYQDNNGYTRFVTGIRDFMNGNLPGKPKKRDFGFGSIVIPFAKTPANLTKALVELSPVGLVKSLTTDAVKFNRAMQNGTATPQMQRKFVNNIGKGVAGTLAMLLGAVLADQGIITGAGDEDKDAAAFQKNVLGIQPYSFVVNGKSYTYDWAAPIGPQFAIAADIVNNIKNGKEEDFGLNMLGTGANVILNALQTGGSVVFEQSFLSGIKNFFNSDNLVQSLIEAAAGAPSQGVPAFLNQIGQLTDPTMRTTYEYGNVLGTAGNKILTRLPGANETLAPVVDVYGREVQRYGGDNSVFNVMFNPANVAAQNTLPAADEVWRLYQALGDKAVFPSVAPNYVEYEGKKYDMTSHEKAEYQKQMGQSTADVFGSMIKKEAYKGLSDSEKAALAKLTNEYSSALTKMDYLKSKGIDYTPSNKWFVDARKSDDPAEYIMLHSLTSGIKNDKDKDGNTIDNSGSLKKKDVIDSVVQDPKARQEYYEAFGVNKTVRTGDTTWGDVNAGGSSASATTIPEAKGYELPNYKAGTLEKISAIGVSPEDYAYIDDRISAKEDKVAYLQELGFDGKQLSGLVEAFVMGKTAKDKMRVAEEDMNIDNGTYIDAYIFGYSSVGSKSERNAQIREYVNGLPLSDEQKDALYNWVKVSRGKTADGKQTGGSSGGSGRRRSGGRSGGKSAGVSQAIPDSVWNEMRSNVKTPTIQYDNPAWGTLKALLDRGDKIREETMQRELAAVDATPYMSSEWRAERKREIRKRYERGMMA